MRRPTLFNVAETTDPTERFGPGADFAVVAGLEVFFEEGVCLVGLGLVRL